MTTDRWGVDVEAEARMDRLLAEHRRSRSKWHLVLCLDCSGGRPDECARRPACVTLFTNAVGYDANGSPCEEWPS